VSPHNFIFSSVPRVITKIHPVPECTLLRSLFLTCGQKEVAPSVVMGLFHTVFTVAVLAAIMVEFLSGTKSQSWPENLIGNVSFTT
jgi:hypothetical protein